MSSPKLAELEEVRTLIASGRQLGALTYAEVATAVSELDLDETDVEALHDLLEGSEIELVDTPPPLDLTPDTTTDALQLFLRDIGKVPLLTRSQEIALAKRIEQLHER